MVTFISLGALFVMPPTHSPRDGIFSEAVVEHHIVEGADTAAQFLILSDAPSDEQWAKRRHQLYNSIHHK